MATLLRIAFVMHQVGSSLGAFGGGLIFDLAGSYNGAWKTGVLIGFTAGVVQIVAGGPTRGRGRASRGPNFTSQPLPAGITVQAPRPPHPGQVTRSYENPFCVFVRPFVASGSSKLRFGQGLARKPGRARWAPLVRLHPRVTLITSKLRHSRS
jgi:hypothetical protein